MLENWSSPPQQGKRPPFRGARADVTPKLNTMEQYPMVESLQLGRQIESRSRQAKEMQRGLVQWLRGAQAAIGWAVILVIVGTGIGVYIQRISQTAITGRHAEQMYVKLKQLEFENSLRREKIANEQEIYRLQSRTNSATGESQYIAPSSAESIYLPIEIPGEPAPIVTSLPPPPAPPETIGEVLWLLVMEKVNSFGMGVSDGE